MRTGHLVIGFIETSTADDLFKAADELTASLTGNPNVQPLAVSVNISEHQVFCDMRLTSTLTELLNQIEADCPTIAKQGSASAGQFTAEFNDPPDCPHCKKALWSEPAMAGKFTEPG